MCTPKLWDRFLTRLHAKFGPKPARTLGPGTRFAPDGAAVAREFDTPLLQWAGGQSTRSQVSLLLQAKFRSHHRCPPKGTTQPQDEKWLHDAVFVTTHTASARADEFFDVMLKTNKHTEC